MDKHVLFVKSEIATCRAKANRDLVSFHKQHNLSFNSTVLAQAGIVQGMVAQFERVDIEQRVITIRVRKILACIR